MKHDVRKLEGALLDAAVAKAEGKTFKPNGGLAFNVGAQKWLEYSPSTSWVIAGPIIERERIIFDDPTEHPLDEGDWYAYVAGKRLDVAAMGPTMLIAAMRAYVTSTFGDEVSIPSQPESGNN